MKNAKSSLLSIALILALLTTLLSGCGQNQSTDNQQEADTLMPSSTATVEQTVVSISEPTKEPTAPLTAAPTNTPVPEPTSVIEGLEPIQLNSIFMLNYLAVITQEIIDSSNSRLNLEEIYSILENYTKPSAVNEDTKDQLAFLFDTIKNYRTLSHKRERLIYIYQQNQAQALRQAIPNPIGILSAVQSKGWKGAAISAIYMAVDSYTSYKSFVAENDLDYLLADWELDDTEEQLLYNLRGETFGYLVDMTNKFSLPDDLTLNKNNVVEFISIKHEKNPRSRIISLEEKKEEFQGLAEYWLVLAQSYYDQGISKNGTPEDFAKCLDAIETYLALPASILRKDRPLAKVLPMAISAAEETMESEEYIAVAEKYAKLIFDNTETSDWELRYFAALTYAELYERTNDVKYLNMAYRIARLNMNYLVKTQRDMNTSYLEEIQIQPVPTPKVPKKPTSEEQQKIDDISKYNSQLESERKVALPPIYEPLLLNCELLRGISTKMEFTPQMEQELDEVLHADDTTIFIVPTVDNLYCFGVAPQPISVADIDINFDSGEDILIPAKYLSEGFSVKVTITDPETGESSIFEDWAVTSVERKDKQDIETFTAKLKGASIKGFKYKIGMKVWIEIVSAANCTPQTLVFNYDVISTKDVFWDYLGFWNRDYAFKRI